MPEHLAEFETFTVIYIASFLFYENQFYLQLYEDNCANKIVDKEMIDCFDDNILETDKDSWFRFVNRDNLTILCLNISDIANSTVKGIDYCCIINKISKSGANYFLKSSVLDDCEHI